MDEEQPATGPDEYIFYIAFAHIVEVLGPTRCRLWLLDHADTSQVNTWLDSKEPKLPCQNTIEVNFDNTLQNQGIVDVAPHRLGNLDLTQMGGDLPLGGEMYGQVAISEQLWNKLKNKPIGRANEYQIKVIVKTQRYSPRNAYLGFAATVLEQSEKGLTRVIFYSWTDQVLGDAWIDLATNGYYVDPATAGCLNKCSVVGEKGAVFVSVELIGSGALSFLIGPKVPYGAGSDTAAGPGPTRRRQANPAIRSAILCSAASDDWLTEARTCIKHYTPAGAREDLERGIISLLGADRDLSLALVSHSYIDKEDRHLLRFGTYDIDENAFSNPSEALGHALRNRQIYLVGCYTAHASDVLRSLEQRFGVEVYGTTRIVGLFDLQLGGLKARRYKHLFARADDVPAKVIFRDIERHLAEARAIKHDEPGAVEEFWEDVPPGSRKRLAGVDLESLRKARVYYDLPGILAVPDSSERDDSGRVSVDSLVQQWLARVTITRPGALAKRGIFLLTAKQREAVQNALAQRKPSVK